MIKEAISHSWKHVTDWAEGYFWVPFTLFSIWASGKLVELMTGHPVKENIDWLVDYQAVSYKCVWIIVFTSLMKQATGTWLTKEEKFNHPYEATLSALQTLVTFGFFVWLFTH